MFGSPIRDVIDYRFSTFFREPINPFLPALFDEDSHKDRFVAEVEFVVVGRTNTYHVFFFGAE